MLIAAAVLCAVALLVQAVLPLGWWSMRCFSLPWHRIVSRWRLTERAEKLTCSCGRSFGMNHDAEAVLPWDMVRELYEGPNSILRPLP